MDLICYSHLRWNFVYQRPQHLIGRLAKHFRTFYYEEPVFDAPVLAYCDISISKESVVIIIPHLPRDLSENQTNEQQQYLLKELFERFEIKQYIAWYYTPMALSLPAPFAPELIVYDCMDELSAFKNAPAALPEQEKALLQQADLVFTGGKSLYEAKKDKHHNIHLFPSSIDRLHFEKARIMDKNQAPPDQSHIPYPRIGFFGVIDERMDIALLRDIAQKKPEWQFVIIGPVVKIDPSTLPVYPNIHYLGSKSYEQLPFYISGWKVAIMPFAMNESTRYISPTKTPEYLAAGKPVVSTPIQDVVKTYGEQGLVFVAENVNKFIEGIQLALDSKNYKQWLKAVDAFLSKNSWDTTYEKMMYLINTRLEDKRTGSSVQIQKEDEYV